MQQFSVGSPRPFAGYSNRDFAYIGFGASQDIPYPGKRQLRAHVAEREADSMEAQTDCAKQSGCREIRLPNRATKKTPVIALSGLPMSNEARLRRDSAVSYLQKSNLEDKEILLQAIDYALLLPRADEFSQAAFLPNVPGQV